MDLAKIAQKEGTSSNPAQPDFDDIVIRSYTEIGSLAGYGNLSVEAREWIVPEKRDITHFLRLTAEGGGEYPRSSAAILPYDRIGDAIAALDQISAMTIRTDRFEFTEIEFRVGDIRAVLFNLSSGKSFMSSESSPKLSFGIQVDDVFVNLNQASRIDDFKNLLRRGKAHIDKVAGTTR